MAASYPASLPVKDPAGANLSTNPHSTLHDGMYDEIVAIATELGTTPKGTAASVKARLDLFATTLTPVTPQLDQGATVNIAKTVAYAKHVRLGQLIVFLFSIQANDAGTAGSQATVALPVTAAAASGIWGSGTILDLSTGTTHVGAWQGTSTTKISLATKDSALSGWGATPNLALANGDFLNGVAVYESAT